MAQEFIVKGIITDIKKKAIANVKIEDCKSGIITNSDKKGRYIIKLKKEEGAHLIFSHVSYEKQEKEIKLDNSKDTINLNIVLNDATHILKEIDVITIRRRTTNIERIKLPKNFFSSDASGGNIESLVATLPGVTSKNELSSQYSVRGGNFDENIVYVNGLEIYRPFLIRTAEQEGLSFVNPLMTERVSFSAGAYDANYGDRMSSVLDIEYKKPKELESSLTASMLGGNLYIGNTNGRVTHISGIRYKTNRSLLNTLDTKAEYDPSFIDFQTNVTYTASNKLEINLQGYLSQNRFIFRPQSRHTTFGTIMNAKQFKVYFDGQEKDNFNSAYTALSINKKIDERNNIGVQFFYFSSSERETYDIRGQYWLNEIDIDPSNGQAITGELLGIGTYHEHARNRLTSYIAGIQTHGTHKIKNNKISWGANITNEKIEDKISEWQMRDSIGYSSPYDDNTVNVHSNLYSDNALNSYRSSLYALSKQTIYLESGRIGISAGIRGSYWSFNNELIVSPRATISFAPEKLSNTSIRLASGVYYQAPFYKEFRINKINNKNSHIELNRDIKSPKSIHLLLGVDYHFRAMDKPFKISSEIYYKHLTNLIPYNVENVKVNYSGRNISSGYITGIDLNLFGEFVPGKDSWINLSFMRAMQKIGDKSMPLPSDQRFNVSFYFQDHIPTYKRLMLNLRALYSQGLPVAINRNDFEKYFRIPSYKRVDVGLTWLLINPEKTKIKIKGEEIKNISIGLDILNIFNIKNVNSYYWITDVFNNRYAVPNYLTSRQYNIRFTIEL